MIIKNVLKAFLYYCKGNVLAHRYYDRRYLCGRWFESKYGRLGARGWEWVVNCAESGKKMKNIRQAPWPVNARTTIVHPSNIKFHVDDINIFQSPGCYFQAHAEIVIGKGSWIAPNVGLITSNHNVYDLNSHDEPKSIVLGDECWIGMNSMILPGVVLGNRTIVGAGSVVTKSFPEGNCIIAGNPAKRIREIWK
jgi:capsular polysaccharide synthesis enzyme